MPYGPVSYDPAGAFLRGFSVTSDIRNENKRMALIESQAEREKTLFDQDQNDRKMRRVMAGAYGKMIDPNTGELDLARTTEIFRDTPEIGKLLADGGFPDHTVDEVLQSPNDPDSVVVRLNKKDGTKDMLAVGPGDADEVIEIKKKNLPGHLLGAMAQYSPELFEKLTEQMQNAYSDAEVADLDELLYKSKPARSARATPTYPGSRGLDSAAGSAPPVRATATPAPVSAAPTPVEEVAPEVATNSSPAYQAGAAARRGIVEGNILGGAPEAGRFKSYRTPNGELSLRNIHESTVDAASRGMDKVAGAAGEVAAGARGIADGVRGFFGATPAAEAASDAQPIAQSTTPPVVKAKKVTPAAAKPTPANPAGQHTDSRAPVRQRSLNTLSQQNEARVDPAVLEDTPRTKAERRKFFLTQARLQRTGRLTADQVQANYSEFFGRPVKTSIAGGFVVSQDRSGQIIGMTEMPQTREEISNQVYRTAMLDVARMKVNATQNGDGAKARRTARKDLATVADKFASQYAGSGQKRNAQMYRYIYNGVSNLVNEYGLDAYDPAMGSTIDRMMGQIRASDGTGDFIPFNEKEIGELPGFSEAYAATGLIKEGESIDEGFDRLNNLREQLVKRNEAYGDISPSRINQELSNVAQSLIARGMDPEKAAATAAQAFEENPEMYLDMMVGQ